MSLRAKLAASAALGAGVLLLAALVWRDRAQLEIAPDLAKAAAPHQTASTSEAPRAALEAARPRLSLPRQGELATIQRLTPEELRSGSEALEQVRFGRDQVIKRRDGAYGFNSASYGATLDSRSVRVAPPYGIKGLGRPHIDLKFEEIRIGDQALAKGGVAEPRLDIETRAVSYDRGVVEERYVLRPEGVEQIFVIASLPERGAITVTSQVSSNLKPPAADRAADKLAFTHRGAEVLSISQAVAIDATGKREPLALSYVDGRVSMTLPAGWVAAATLPILIDPMIGGPVTIDAKLMASVTTVQGRSVRTADVAYSAARNEYLVVWDEPFGAGEYNFDVLGQRVGATGTLLGQPLQIGASTLGDYEPTVCWASGVDRYLVAWRQDPNDNAWEGDQRIQGRVLGGDGAFVGAEFTVDDAAGQDFGPSAAFDGARWYVCWTQVASAADLNARGRFVSTAGAPEGAADPDVEADFAAGPTAAFVGGTYVIAWEKQPAGGTSGIVARTMDAAGAFTSTAVAVSQSVRPAMHADVAPGSDKAFIVWQEQAADGSWDVQGRSLTPALVFSGSSFDIATQFGDQVTPRAAYSPANNQWVVAYTDPISGREDVYANRVGSSGIVFPAERVSRDGQADFRPELAINTASNEAFIVFLHKSGQAFRLKGRRSALGEGAPATPGTPVGEPNPNATGTHVVSWAPSAGSGLVYELERSADGGTIFGVIATTSSASFTEPGLAEGSYVYRVRARNAESVYSSYSGQSPPVVVDQTAPAAPADLGQFRSDGLTAIPPGGTTTESGVLLRATVSDGATRVRLEVEVKPTATPFDGTGLHASALVESGSTASVVVTPLAQGSYHWRARAADEVGNAGPFTLFGGSPDFIIGPSAPPAAPANLTATPGNAQVALNWEAAVGAATYAVKRGTSLGGPYTTISTGASTSHLDTTVSNGTTYYYVVTASNAAGESGTSNEAPATPKAPPPAPANLVATPGNNQVELTWSAAAGADSYRVKRSISSGGPYEVIAEGVAATSYVDRTALNGTTYFYVVSGVNVGGEGVDSSPASATPLAPPAPPTLSATPGDGQVNLNWTSAAGAASYSVYRSLSGAGPFGLIASGITGTSHLDTGLANGTEYFYVVTASNAAGESVFSNVVSAVPNGTTTLAAPIITTPSQSTNDATPTIEGTSAPNVTITVFFKQGATTVQTLTTLSSPGGAWSVTASPKPEGAYLVFARASSGAVVSPDSDAITIWIDTTPPTIELVTSSTFDGVYGVGSLIDITVIFSEWVTLPEGELRVVLNTGAEVPIYPFGPASSASGAYTVSAGENSPRLNADSPLTLVGGTLRDAAGNDAILQIPFNGNLGDALNIVIDTMAPVVVNVSSATSNGTYEAGASINVRVTFSEPVTLAGTSLQVTLDTGAVVSISPFGPSTTANGTYVVGPTHNSPDLTVIGLALQAGAGLWDQAGNSAILPIPPGQNLGDLKNIVISNVAPAVASVTSPTLNGTYGLGAGIVVVVNFSKPLTLTNGSLLVTLDTGAVVAISPFGPSSTASGTYLVAAEQISGDLTAFGLSLQPGALLKDAAGTSANLAIPGGQNLGDLKNIVIDGVAPTVASVTSASADGTYVAGSSIGITIVFSEPVTLAGGSLLVSLDSGGTVAISPFGPSSVVSGAYLVVAGQNSADLTSTGLSLQGSATLRDTAGNNALLSIPTGQNLGDFKNIVVNGGAPVVLQPPTNVRATPYNNVVDLEWDASASLGVVGYRVYRKTGAAGAWELRTTTNVVISTRYRDDPAPNGPTYFYRVTAVAP